MDWHCRLCVVLKGRRLCRQLAQPAEIDKLDFYLITALVSRVESFRFYLWEDKDVGFGSDSIFFQGREACCAFVVQLALSAGFI